MKVYSIDETIDILDMVNKNCKNRIAELEKMLAEYKEYKAKHYPSN